MWANSFPHAKPITEETLHSQKKKRRKKIKGFLLPSERPAITNDRREETQLKLQTTDKEIWGTQRTPAVRPCINDNELIKLICAG